MEFDFERNNFNKIKTVTDRSHNLVQLVIDILQSRKA